MTPYKEIGECLISHGEKEYFFRPSLRNMERIGEPQEIVQAFFDLHHNEVADLLSRAFPAYGFIPQWLIGHIKDSTYGRKAFMAALVVLSSCCEGDVTDLIGTFKPSKGKGRAFKYRKGAMPESDIIIVAQSLITHGIIGKAKVRRLQKHESEEKVTEFRPMEYIVAARNHFGMSKAEAEQLTMTEFQLMLAGKYPDQKGYTREEYDAAADDFFALREKRRAAAAA